ncbi:MAG: adenine phosphoribosyltransferase [Lachnospiraceae bacterium]|jgi:adenine phosphoribosyltransferase|nr:adenine phosphoribosyltransferase [Lachnospiraceae bacterium]MBQ5475705.1 adenine phosphoribosyltransferase [Lachnospiraceae bacterium]
MKDLKDFVVTIPNYPKEGIMFRDITSVIQSAEGLQLAIDSMQNLVKDIDYDVIVGPESRGFVFGMPMAYNDHKPFVMVRKPGKLPRETISQSYDLEYGSATLEIHKDALYPGEKVLIVDDLIATGGTTEAIVKLVERLDAKVAGMVFLMELKGLHGRDRLKDYRIEAAISYDGK